MSQVLAALLLHRGHGHLHADLVLGTGSRCVTIHLQPASGRWRSWLGAPHRRRYLTFRGPVAGRGAVEQLWRGHAWNVRSATRLRCRLHPNRMLSMKMRRIFREAGSPPADFALALLRARGELVVPLCGTATLPRS